MCTITILKAAKNSGIEIPTHCDKELTDACAITLNELP